MLPRQIPIILMILSLNYMHLFKSHGWITFKRPLAVRWNIHLASQRGRFRGQCGWRAFRGAGLLASRVSLTCWVQYDTPSPMIFYKWSGRKKHQFHSISMAPWHCFTNASQMATMLVNCKSTYFRFAAPNEDVLYIYMWAIEIVHLCIIFGLNLFHGTCFMMLTCQSFGGDYGIWGSYQPSGHAVTACQST